jgi:hypothetical protein
LSSHWNRIVPLISVCIKFIGRIIQI